VPAFGKATENCPPGGTMPESHPLASDVDVCATPSVFVHVTVAPTATSTESGAKAVLVNVDAFSGIVTVVDAVPGVETGPGAGDGAGAGEGAGVGDGDE